MVSNNCVFLSSGIAKHKIYSINLLLATGSQQHRVEVIHGQPKFCGKETRHRIVLKMGTRDSRWPRVRVSEPHHSLVQCPWQAESIAVSKDEWNSPAPAMSSFYWWPSNYFVVFHMGITWLDVIDLHLVRGKHLVMQRQYLWTLLWPGIHNHSMFFL